MARAKKPAATPSRPKTPKCVVCDMYRAMLEEVFDIANGTLQTPALYHSTEFFVARLGRIKRISSNFSTSSNRNEE